MRIFSTIVSTVGTVMLAVTLFAAGYFVCSLPATTMLLSQAVSNYETSPYQLDDMSSLAVAARDLTVDERPDGTTNVDARNTFNRALMKAAANSAEKAFGGEVNAIELADTSKREMWKGMLSHLGTSDIATAFDVESADDTAAKMAGYSDTFALDDAALRHLDDCNYLINSLLKLVVGFAIAAAVCFVLLLVMRRWKALGIMLTVAPVLLIVALVALGAWAFIDFQSFFTAFHGVFFPQGNWTFNAESLLISMYPTAFWMGMGTLWLTTTLLAAIIALFIGRSFAHMGH